MGDWLQQSVGAHSATRDGPGHWQVIRRSFRVYKEEGTLETDIPR